MWMKSAARNQFCPTINVCCRYNELLVLCRTSPTPAVLQNIVVIECKSNPLILSPATAVVEHALCVVGGFDAGQLAWLVYIIGSMLGSQAFGCVKQRSVVMS